MTMTPLTDERLDELERDPVEQSNTAELRRLRAMERRLLEWADAVQAVASTEAAAQDAIQGARKRFDDARQAYVDAMAAEKATRETLLAELRNRMRAP